ncbi:lipase 3-like [Helicoverpa zea]|uniref:lipase 3-like n=1 Tax=Helicoverpa zea TaxID=7113 RepID=UPI001F56F81E|nr:lipase 3-like [Helicoverpa zea]
MSFVYKLCLVLVFGVFCEAELRKEAYMTVPSLIKAAGYPVEKHRVTTPDGYVLQMHRIPAGRRSARRTGDLNAKGKKAILIIHGLLGGSSDFVIMGPERSLSYLLADAGYDVWLGNLRGTVYSTHTNLTKNDPKFWDFSFHEHGKYDLPAMIDRVLNITGLDKIMLVGYSMGTTSSFIMFSQRPEYNDKLIAFVALAPAVYMDNMKLIANLALNTLDIVNVMRARGMTSLQPQFLQGLISTLCNLKQPETDLCTNFIYTLVGEDFEQNDLEMLPIYLYRVQPASWRALEHYGKIAISGVFTTFSGGLSGPVKPYNLTNVKVPVTLLYGENDQLTEKSQIMRLADQLKSTGVLEEVRPGCSWPKFNHLDFVFAKDVGKIFNKPLIKLIDQLYNKYYIA